MKGGGISRYRSKYRKQENEENISGGKGREIGVSKREGRRNNDNLNNKHPSQLSPIALNKLDFDLHKVYLLT